jgi:hypothetical protein
MLSIPLLLRAHEREQPSRATCAWSACLNWVLPCCPAAVSEAGAVVLPCCSVSGWCCGAALCPAAVLQSVSSVRAACRLMPACTAIAIAIVPKMDTRIQAEK